MNGFGSLEELYLRVKPALKSKRKELNHLGYYYIQEADIWNYLKNNVWVKSSNLTLADVVNDIMTINNIELEHYVQDTIAKEKRDVNI